MTDLAVSAVFVFKDTTSVSFGSDDIIDYSGAQGSIAPGDYRNTPGQATITVVNIGGAFSDYLAERSALGGVLTVTINAAVVFKGICTDVSEITMVQATIEAAGYETAIANAFDCLMVTTEDYPYANPSDVSKMLPVVIGTAKRVPFLGIDVGASGVLFAEIADDATSLELCDASNFPSSGTIGIGAEIITYTGRTGNTLTGLTRGASSTEALVHDAGETVEEHKSEYVYAIGHPVTSIDAVYVGNQRIDPDKVAHTIYTGGDGDEHATYTGMAVIAFDDPLMSEAGLIGQMLRPSLPSSGNYQMAYGQYELLEAESVSKGKELSLSTTNHIQKCTLQVKAKHDDISGNILHFYHTEIDAGNSMGTITITDTYDTYELDLSGYLNGLTFFVLAFENYGVGTLYIDDLRIIIDANPPVSRPVGPDWVPPGDASGGPDAMRFRTSIFADVVGYDVSAPDDVMDLIVSDMCGFGGSTSYDATYGTGFAFGFAILAKPVPLDLIYDLATQAGSISYFLGDTHYLKYFAATPSATHTVLRAEVDAHTAAIGFTAQADIINKITCPYNRRWWTGDQTDRTPDMASVIAEDSTSQSANGLHHGELVLYAVADSGHAQDVADWIIDHHSTVKKIIYFAGEHTIKLGDIIDFDDDEDLDAVFCGLTAGTFLVIDLGSELNGTRAVSALELPAA